VTVTRKNACSAYTSATTACDQKVALKAKTRAAAAATARRTSRMRRRRNSTATAALPSTAESRFTRHATDPNGTIDTHAWPTAM
jgi:hypothetical protein